MPLDPTTGAWEARFKKGIDYRAFPPEMTPEERFALAREAGFDGIELVFSATGALPLDASDEELIRLRALGGRYVPICGVNGGRALLEAPLTHPDPERRQAAFKMAQRLIEMTARLEADTLLTAPGVVVADVPYDDAYSFCVDTMGKLARYAAERGVRLAVENVWNKFLLSPLEMRSFIDEVASDWVGAYFDVANTLLFGFPQHWIRILNHRILRVHMKDFRLSVGNINGFLQPLQGDVDWPAVMQALVEVKYRGFLTVEIPSYQFCGARTVYDASSALDAIIALTPA
ncbi:MAG: sugar phosphate isomerase/epimerase [Anaerolineae bacterium]|nr:sugar phosphate isomerase/epimerase [Anaerolineae bacterium]